MVLWLVGRNATVMLLWLPFDVEVVQTAEPVSSAVKGAVLFTSDGARVSNARVWTLLWNHFTGKESVTVLWNYFSVDGPH